VRWGARVSFACIAVWFCATAFGADAVEPISDEALRLAALRAVFPGMEVSPDPDAKSNEPPPARPKPGEIVYPDALAGERVYRVIGKATNKAESLASADILKGGLSTTREVKFRLFRWPGEASAGLVAVLQYKFQGAIPSPCCWSMGMLVHLAADGNRWTKRDEYLLETSHHSSLQRIELLRLTREGLPELVIESEVGGAGSVGSSLQVFDLSHGRFEELLYTFSRAEFEAQDRFTQTLEVGRTRNTNGRQFCFLKTTSFEGGKWFGPPRITHPCYLSGEGRDPERGRMSEDMLGPAR